MSHEAAAIVERGRARNSDESAAYPFPMAPITWTSSAARASHGFLFYRVARSLPCGVRATRASCRCAGRDVVEGERYRDAGVMAQQRDHIGNADMTQRLHRTVVEPLRDPARVRQAHRYLVDDLLAPVVE